jgi:hypothetical protein
MLLLDRPAGYREVTRVRVADLLGRPLSEGPVFVDLDRISSATFAEIIAGGGWGQRVINSVVLRDTDGEYAHLRERVGAAFAAPAAREARFQQRREQAEVRRAAARQALDGDSGDAALAALHARLAVGEAATALVELNGDRLTLTHFVESAERALGRFAPFLRALARAAPPDGAARSLAGLSRLRRRARTVGGGPRRGRAAVGRGLAWAAFTYGDQTAEEIAAVFGRLGRFPALLCVGVALRT